MTKVTKDLMKNVIALFDFLLQNFCDTWMFFYIVCQVDRKISTVISIAISVQSSLYRKLWKKEIILT